LLAATTDDIFLIIRWNFQQNLGKHCGKFASLLSSTTFVSLQWFN